MSKKGKSEVQGSSTAKRAGKFVVIGALLTVVNYVIYTFMVMVVINNNDFLWLSTLVSTSITTVLAYVLHSRITWRERVMNKTSIVKFFVWNFAVALVVNPLLTQFFSLANWLYNWAYGVCAAMGLPFDFEFIQSTGAFGLTACVTMVLNYLFYDKFVFGKSGASEGERVVGEPLVSVVVPIYNVEKYVEKCLESIGRQSYRNLEMILVDDGSTDSSGVLADKFAKSDKRVRVIHQKNAGQSVARSAGLLAATGEYVCFIDSDDAVARGYVAGLLAPLTHGADLTVCGMHYKRLRQGTAKDVYTKSLRMRWKHESLKAYVLCLLAVDGRMYSSVNKMYRTMVARECKFDERLKFAEDTKFVLDYLKRADDLKSGELTSGEGVKIAFVRKPLYIYNYGTEGSTIRDTGVEWKNWERAYERLKKWTFDGSGAGVRARFWLMMVGLRWRISHRRSVKRARG